MLKLSETRKFLQDFKGYNQAVNKITDAAARQHGIDLINQLKSQTVLIDERHSSRNNGNIDPRAVRDNIRITVEIRIQLNQLIKDAGL